MPTPTYSEAKKLFYATGYELRDYLARTISGENPDGSSFEHAGVSNVLVEVDGDYPPRPVSVGSVVFIGPDDPDTAAEVGDVWLVTGA